MQLEEDVSRAIATANGMPDHLNDDGVNLLLPVRQVVAEIVRRLLAGGISETAIRNTLVHYSEPNVAYVTLEGDFQRPAIGCECPHCIAKREPAL